MSSPPPYGLCLSVPCAYNVHMRFNGQASDYTWEDGACEVCGGENITATSYTISNGEQIQFECPDCGATGELVNEYL